MRIPVNACNNRETRKRQKCSKTRRYNGKCFVLLTYIRVIDDELHNGVHHTQPAFRGFLHHPRPSVFVKLQNERHPTTVMLLTIASRPRNCSLGRKRALCSMNIRAQTLSQKSLLHLKPRFGFLFRTSRRDRSC